MAELYLIHLICVNTVLIKSTNFVKSDLDRKCFECLLKIIIIMHKMVYENSLDDKNIQFYHVKPSL